MLSWRLLSSRQHMLRRLHLQPHRYPMLQRRQLLQRRKHLRHLLWPPGMLYRSLMYSVHLEWRDYSIYNHRCCAAEDDHEGWRCDYAGTYSGGEYEGNCE